MALELTSEQKELRDSLRGLLTKRTDTLWPALVSLGVCEIPFPERWGGAGYGAKEIMVVMTELGRSLAGVPYLSSVAAAGSVLIEGATDSVCAQHVPGMASGSVTAALVAGYPLTTSGISALADGDDLVLSGRQDFVIDGTTADLLVIVASGPDGLELAVVSGDAPGVSRTPLEALDFTRELARVELDGVRARRAGGKNLLFGLARAQTLLLASVAAEQVGAARACLEMSVEYAKTRQQFGRAIGSFQSIKHRLADMLIAIELAEAAVLDAANAAEDRRQDEFVNAVATARVLASRASVFAAEESIQVHGGIGFTWEHPLHRYFRRAKNNELMFGSIESHLEVLATSL
ncbi:acyl-CoA dehydrogenase family protein [Rhodococcus fascians]|nr:acyl-CoA dehydrogenase family protein [Rhodococcus fascians]MBY4430750.1 acyl-CoA dehydrogenase family protein [Rhodococcus fascians]